MLYLSRPWCIPCQFIELSWVAGEVACERGACLPAYECCKGAFDLVAIKGITEAGPWGFCFLQRGCLCARWDAVQGASGTPARGGASCAYCRLACCEVTFGFILLVFVYLVLSDSFDGAVFWTFELVLRGVVGFDSPGGRGLLFCSPAARAGDTVTRA
jgi:hypothetical protein